MELETIIKVNKTRQGKYLLTFDSGRKIVILEDILIKYQLFKGTQMTANFIAKIEQAQVKEKMYQAVLHYLSIQMRTVAEVRKYLRTKEASESDLEEIIQKLLEKGYLDDENYAKQYTNLHIRLRDKGPFQIRQALIKKGVADNFINEALEETSSEDIYHNALLLAKKCQKKYQKKTEKEAKQKITQRLLAKGYSIEVAKQVVNELVFEHDLEQEWEELQKLGDKLWRKRQKYDIYKCKEKVRQALYQKGYNYDLINEYIEQKLNEE